MKKFLLLFLTVIFCVNVDAQTVIIGSGTASNTTTTYPAPFGNYWGGSKQQQIYRASELTAAGLLPGAAITTLGFNVTAVNTGAPLVGYNMKMAHTTDTVVTNTWLTGLTTVVPAATYTPVVGWNNFTIPVFVWNGSSSIVIETCFDNGTFTENASTTFSSVTGAVTHHFRQDNSANTVCASTVTTTLLTDRTNLRIVATPPGGCIQPVSLNDSAVKSTSAVVYWTNMNSTTPISYDIELVAANSTPTGVPTHTNVTNPDTLTGLIPNVAYDYYVRAHCTATDTSAWSGPRTFTTLPTCPQPTTLTATNITSSSADLNWTEVGSASQWQISIGLSPNTTPTPILVTGTKPYALTGLPDNTCFDYHVRSICGSGDTSSWTGPFTFCTTIAPLSCPGTSNSSIVFTEEFFYTSTSQVALPQASLPGWTRSGAGDPTWSLESDGTSSGAGASGGAQGSQGYCYMEVSSSSNPSYDTLTSPSIDLSGATGAARIKFWKHMFGTAQGKMSLIIDNGTSLTQIWSDSGQTQASQASPWDSIVLNLNTFVGQTIQLKFVGQAIGCCAGDMAIDQIEIEACVACAAPSALAASNVTATGANLTWTENGSATTWDVHVVPTNGPAPTGTTTPSNPGVTTNNPYALTGLTLYQAVDIYVRAACGGTSGNSSWAGPITVLPCAPLAGTYTINPGAAASATNFQTLNAAAFALQCGVSAPVVFNMATGNTFTEQVEFVEVTGSSTTNTITFNGNGDTVTNANTTGGYHTILLNGADNFRFNNLVVEANGTIGFPMHLYNGPNATKNNQFKNCTFQVPVASTSTLMVPFAMSGSLTSATTACTAKAEDNIVDSCVARGGYYGMTMYGSFTAADYGNGNQIKNTEVVDFYAYGIYFLYQDTCLISANNIHRANRTNTTTFYGIYQSGTANGNVIERNRVHNPFPFATTSTFYGIETFASGTAANSTIIKNNLIENVKSNGTQYGIYQSFANNTSTWNNTVVLDDPTSTGSGLTRGIWINGGTGQNVQNNNVSITRMGSTGLQYGIYNTASPVTCNYNNVWIPTAANNHYGFNGSANQTTLTAWKASTPTVGANSYDVDPIFSATAPDYSPSNSQLNATANATLGVTQDYFGVARAATPDIGAFEFTVAATDIATSAVLSPDPSVGCYSATDTIKIQVTNFGSATIDFSVNSMVVTGVLSGTASGTATATVNTGTLAPLATLSVTLSPTVNMTANGPYSINAYATTAGDANASNDTLSAPVTYTVGLVSGTISASPDVLCVSGTSTVTMTGNAGGLVQWQTSASGTAPWANVGTGMNPHTSATLTSTTYYRALLTCNAASDSTNVDTITVNNPMITATTGDTVCGTDTVNLTATSTFPINWYATATSSTILDTGATFSTIISSTDTFYAAASAGAGKVLITEVCQFTTASYTNPGAPYPASMDDPIELTNIGTSPIDISGWKLEVTGGATGTVTIPSGNVLPGGGTFVIDRGFTTVANIPNVYLFWGGANTGSSSANGYILSNASGIVQDVTATNSFNVVGTGTPAAPVGSWTGTTGASGGTGGIRRTALDDTDDGADWTIATGANATNYGTINVAFTPAGCTGSRVPVIAVSNPGPPVVASATDTVVCWGDSTTLMATGAGAGGTYSWNNGGVTGVTFNPTATTMYTLTGTNAAGCASKDSVLITRIEQFYDTVNATPMTLCLGDTVTLTAADSNANPPPPYCVSGATSTADTKIDTVSFNGVTTGTSPTTGEDYTDNTAIVIPAPAGVALPLSVVNGSASSFYYGGTLTVYIDYNQNGVFDAAELVYTASTTGLNTIAPTTITIPTTALNGLTRMRLVFPESSPSVPCGTWTWGETEDYTINITGATPAASYTWAYMPGSLNGPVQMLAPTATTTYVVTQSDANGCTATTSVNVVVNPLPNVTASITPTATCVNSTAVPTGGGAMTYAWSGGLIDTVAFAVDSTWTYTVTGTDANGCTATSAASVTAVPASNALAQALANNTASTPGTQNQTQAHPDGNSVSYYDASCNIIATVDDGAGGNVLGNTMSMVTVDATVQTHMGQPYVQRWYSITPTNNGPATVKLFMTQADFTAYNAAAAVLPHPAAPTMWPSLPVDSSDVAGIANIRITKFSGPITATSTTSDSNAIIPAVVWNSPAQRWELTFPVTGFSNFHIHAANPNNAALPVNLTDFTVVKNGSVSDASWNTMSESNNSHFNVQRSLDGNSFATLGKVNSKAVNGTSNSKLAYNFTDEQPQIGHNYYRLQQVDMDGNMSYSTIIDLVWGADGSVVSIYPNPATDKLNIDVAIDKVVQMEVRLLDMSGRVIKSVMQRTAKGMNNVTFDMTDVASGVYGVQIYENNVLTHSGKVNKQVK